MPQYNSLFSPSILLKISLPPILLPTILLPIIFSDHCPLPPRQQVVPLDHDDSNHKACNAELFQKSVSPTFAGKPTNFPSTAARWLYL
jgi:hypothetical protein